MNTERCHANIKLNFGCQCLSGYGPPDADLDPNFPFSIICITLGTLFYVQAFCLCSFQSQHKILQ